MPKILIVGQLNGEPTPFDNQWLVEYDPSRRGVDGNGKRMIAHLVTTADPEQARVFLTRAEAEECFKQSYGTRKDGRPNRPLTAFIVEIRGVDERMGRESSSWAPPKQALVTFVAEFFYS